MTASTSFAVYSLKPTYAWGEHKIYSGFYDNFYSFPWRHQERAFCSRFDSRTFTRCVSYARFRITIQRKERERETERKLSHFVKMEFETLLHSLPLFFLPRARKMQHSQHPGFICGRITAEFSEQSWFDSGEVTYGKRKRNREVQAFIGSCCNKYLQVLKMSYIIVVLFHSDINW